MLRGIAGVVCFGATLVLTPSVGCGSSDSTTWKYDERDMEQAVAGTYSGSLGADGSAETLTLTIARRTAPGGSTPAGLRLQCGDRVFAVKPAGACISLSRMLVEADLVSTGNTVPTGHFSGEFTAYYTLTGMLELSRSGGGTLTASYDGSRFSDWKYSTPSGEILLDLELQ